MKVAVIGLLAALVSRCSDVCADSVVTRVDAPGSRHSAVLFQRDCGATTGLSTQVSIVSRGDIPTGDGNTFRADDDHGAAANGSLGGPWAELKWLAPDHLLIRYAAKTRIFKRADSVDGVQISYEPLVS